MTEVRYFTFKELTATATGMANAPATWEQLENLLTLALFLDGIREKFGKPVKVNSGFRSPAVNVAVGGSKTSAHLKGLAADIAPVKPDYRSKAEFLDVLKGFLPRMDQLIVYTEDGSEHPSKLRFAHVGLSENPRGMLLWKR